MSNHKKNPYNTSRKLRHFLPKPKNYRFSREREVHSEDVPAIQADEKTGKASDCVVLYHAMCSIFKKVTKKE